MTMRRSVSKDTRSSSRQRGYTRQWEKARAVHLLNHPLCVMCMATGRITPANVVDHIVPHRGDQALFWDRSNWQSLCAEHHNRDKRIIEAGGVVPGCDADGIPHHRRDEWMASGGE